MSKLLRPLARRIVALGLLALPLLLILAAVRLPTASAIVATPMTERFARGELLAGDLAADALPAASAPAAAAMRASTQALQVGLPYGEAGSWLRLELAAVPREPVLVVETALAGVVSVVLPDGTRLARSKLAPPADTNVSSLALAFELPPTLRRGDIVHVHFEHRARLPVALMLFEDGDWRRRDRRLLIATAVIGTALLAFALIAVSYWVVLRQQMFGYYTAHVLMSVLFIAASTGFLYVWPSGPWWARFGIHGQWAFGAWGVAMLVGFARHFLAIASRWPRFARALDVMRWALIALGLALLLSPWQLPWAGAALSALTLTINLALLLAAAVLARAGSRYAFYYLAAWLPLSAATTVRALQGLGFVVPYEIGHFYGLGAFCEAFVLNLGLADQVLGIRRERDTALQTAAQAEQLERQNEVLKENMRLREQVEHMSRHDLKTPLNSIVAVPQLMRESGPLNRDQLELMDLVERAGFRVLNMVNLSLDLLKIEQGRYQWLPEPVDIGRLIHWVAADLRPLAQAKSVRLEQAIGGGDGGVGGRVFVAADETLCYSILANLLKNAVEAAPDGSAVGILVTPGQPDGSIRIEIHNDGTVPPAMQGRFFEKYASAGKHGGTGFGTYSARLMARIQQGELVMESSAAEGTTLILTLRGALPDFEASGTSGFGELAAPDVELPPLKVLLVDDDAHNLLVLRRYLPSPPLALRFATDGREALAALLAEPADVVLMDLEMPVMKGEDAVERLRAHEREQHRRPILAIALSAHDDEATRRRALERGFDLYLTKPVRREQLLAALRGVGGAGTTDAPAPAPAARDAVVPIDADLRDALPGFLASRRVALVEMRDAAAGGDRALVRGLAHRLAGSFALYGFHWAAAAAQGIEQGADTLAADALQEALAELLEHLDTAEVRFEGAGGTAP